VQRDAEHGGRALHAIGAVTGPQAHVETTSPETLDLVRRAAAEVLVELERGDQLAVLAEHAFAAPRRVCEACAGTPAN
jgi:hypothetical protein